MNISQDVEEQCSHSDSKYTSKTFHKFQKRNFNFFIYIYFAILTFLYLYFLYSIVQIYLYLNVNYMLKLSI